MTRSSAFFHHIKKQVDASACDFIDRLLYGGQTRERIATDIYTVKTDNTDIFRN